MATRPSTTRQGYTAAYNRVRRSILLRDGCCTLCGSLDHLQVDHIVPLSQGGTNDPANLRVLCRKCNLNRRDMPPSWRQSPQQLRARFAARGAPSGALVGSPPQITAVGVTSQRFAAGRATGALAEPD